MYGMDAGLHGAEIRLNGEDRSGGNDVLQAITQVRDRVWGT